MSSWFGADLLLIGKAVIAALLFFAYTTITGTAGYCLVRSIQHLIVRHWKPAFVRGLYSLAVGVSLTIIIAILIRATHDLTNRLESTLLAIPYILGLFGIFFIPGEEEYEYESEGERGKEKDKLKDPRRP
jgi:Na+/alanine symporter